MKNQYLKFMFPYYDKSAAIMEKETQ